MGLVARHAPEAPLPINGFATIAKSSRAAFARLRPCAPALVAVGYGLGDLWQFAKGSRWNREIGFARSATDHKPLRMVSAPCAIPTSGSGAYLGGAHIRAPDYWDHPVRGRLLHD